jgi:hypothetical protein
LAHHQKIESHLGIFILKSWRLKVPFSHRFSVVKKCTFTCHSHHGICWDVMVIPKFVCFIEEDCAIKPVLFGGIFQFDLWGSGVVVDLTFGIIGTQTFLSRNVKLIYIPCNIEKKAFVNSIIPISWWSFQTSLHGHTSAMIDIDDIIPPKHCANNNRVTALWSKGSCNTKLCLWFFTSSTMDKLIQHNLKFLYIGPWKIIHTESQNLSINNYHKIMNTKF